MRVYPNTIRQTRGVALITVLLVVSLATTAAVAMANRQHIDIRRTENTLLLGQLQQYQYGVELWSKQFLSQDRKDNQIDHNGENWAKRLPPLPVEGGTVSGYLEDVQGRFNLNNLQLTGDKGNVELERFRRLLRILEIDESLAERIQDWLDPDQDEKIAAGAEDVYYLGLNPAYRTAGQILQSPSELLLLKEFKREDYEKLLPYISTLPQVTPINVNTAPLQVLMCLVDNLSENDIQPIIENRDSRPYESVDDFLKEAAFTDKGISPDGLGVASDYFILFAEVKIGHITVNTTHLFERNDKGMIKTFIRTEGYM